MKRKVFTKSLLCFAMLIAGSNLFCGFSSANINESENVPGWHIENMTGSGLIYDLRYDPNGGYGCGKLIIEVDPGIDVIRIDLVSSVTGADRFPIYPDSNGYYEFDVYWDYVIVDVGVSYNGSSHIMRWHII